MTTQQRRKLLGLCHSCGGPVQARRDGSRPSECRPCATHRAEKRRAIFAAARVGVVSANAPTPTQGRTVEQLEAERVLVRAKLIDLTRAIVRARSRAEGERRKLHGLCVDCGVSCERTRCERHTAEHTARARRRAREKSDASPAPRRACGCKGHGAHRIECPERARRAA